MVNEIGSPTCQDLLAGKIALVTGGASGIGAAISSLFAQQGAAVAIMDTDRDRTLELAEKIVGDGGKAIGLVGDVTLSADCDRVIRNSLDELGPIQILCNNAGIIRRASVVETTEQEWDRLMAVNVKGIFLMSRRVVPAMAREGSGVIINTGSGWGLSGGARAAAYCASKGAVVQLTKAMAIDHGPQGIRVNCICPGDVETPMLEKEAKELGVEVVSLLEEAHNRPLQRVGSPEEIAKTALFLASDASSYMTGAALVVDGGGLAG